MRYSTVIGQDEARSNVGEPQPRRRKPLSPRERRRCVEIAVERMESTWTGMYESKLYAFEEYEPGDALAARVVLDCVQFD